MSKNLSRILRSIVTRVFVATQEMDSPNKSSSARTKMKTQRKFHFPSTHVGTHSTKEIVYNGGTIRSINKID